MEKPRKDRQRPLPSLEVLIIIIMYSPTHIHIALHFIASNMVMFQSKEIWGKKKKTSANAKCTTQHHTPDPKRGDITLLNSG